MTRLAFDGVALARGARILADGLTFALAPGDAALVTGANGAGKSTLVRVAAGLLAPAAGQVTRDGSVALLGEAHALDPDRRLAEALAFWARLDGTAARLEEWGLAPLAAVPVRLLSTGQRRRAALARVAASDAAIWLLDEPANGLDTAGVALLEDRIAAHRRAGGIAVIATHQPIAAPGASSLHLVGEGKAPVAAAHDFQPRPEPGKIGPGRTGT